MKATLERRTYHLRYGVDVNMYQTLLDPDFTLESHETLSEQEQARLWERFDMHAYRQLVLQLTIPELKKLLAALPQPLRVQYVEGSAEIISPSDYSKGGDFLSFQITAAGDLSERQMQALLNACTDADWNAEFGSPYAISERICEHYTLDDFQRNE